MSFSPGWLPGEIDARLRALGLSDLCEMRNDLSEQRLRELAGEPITRARTRRLHRLEDAELPVLFVKLQVVRPSNLPLRKWPSYLAKGPSLQREAKAIGLLRSMGVRTPDLLAAASRVSWAGTMRAALLIREVPGYVDLATAIRNGLEPAAVASSAAAVEAVVAHLHDLGLGLNGALYRDFLVPRAGAESMQDVVVIDPGGLGRGRRRQRRDLRQLAGERAAILSVWEDGTTSA